MPTAPQWFLDELRAFDPDLRLRWSIRTHSWALERQVRRGLHPGTTKGDPFSDDYIRARDGYILVGTIPFGGLHRYVFQRLRDSDLWARGGWQRVADEMDQADEMTEQARLEKFSRENREYARDLYNLYAIRDGRTVFNAGV